MGPQRQATMPVKLCRALLAYVAAFSHIVVRRFQQDSRRKIRPMPTLFRFLFILAVIAGIIYGSMLALVYLVEPRERDVTVRIPSERLNPAPQE